jgi:hypothetical protein
MIRWIFDLVRKLRRDAQLEWRQVPPPNWRSKRSGVDYW